MSKTDLDGSLKQLLWTQFQTESFSPNDTRVATRRLSAQGLRLVIKSITTALSTSNTTTTTTIGGGGDPNSFSSSSGGGWLSAIRSSSVPIQAAIPMESMSGPRLARILSGDEFEDRLWSRALAHQAAVTSSSSINWTSFCTSFLVQLVESLRLGGSDEDRRPQRQQRASRSPAQCAAQGASQRRGGGGCGDAAPASSREASCSGVRCRSPCISTATTTVSAAAVEAQQQQQQGGGGGVSSKSINQTTISSSQQQLLQDQTIPFLHRGEPAVIELAMSPIMVGDGKQVSGMDAEEEEESPKITGVVHQHMHEEGVLLFQQQQQQQRDLLCPGGPQRHALSTTTTTSNAGAATHRSRGSGSMATEMPTAPVAPLFSKISEQQLLFTSAPGMPVFMPAPTRGQPSQSSPPRKPTRRVCRDDPTSCGGYGGGGTFPGGRESSCLLENMSCTVPAADHKQQHQQTLVSMSSCVGDGACTPPPTLRPSSAVNRQVVIPRDRETIDAGPSAALRSRVHQDPQLGGSRVSGATGGGDRFVARSQPDDFGGLSLVMAIPPPPPSSSAAAPHSNGLDFESHHDDLGSSASSSYEGWVSQQRSTSGSTTTTLTGDVLYDARYDAVINKKLRSFCARRELFAAVADPPLVTKTSNEWPNITLSTSDMTRAMENKNEENVGVVPRRQELLTADDSRSLSGCVERSSSHGSNDNNKVSTGKGRDITVTAHSLELSKHGSRSGAHATTTRTTISQNKIVALVPDDVSRHGVGDDTRGPHHHHNSHHGPHTLGEGQQPADNQRRQEPHHQQQSGAFSSSSSLSSLSSTPAAVLNDPQPASKHDRNFGRSLFIPVVAVVEDAKKPLESLNNMEHGHVLVPPVRRPLHAVGQQAASAQKPLVPALVSSTTQQLPLPQVATTVDDVPLTKRNASVTSSVMKSTATVVVPPPPPPTSRPRSKSPPVGSSASSLLRLGLPPTTRPLRPSS